MHDEKVTVNDDWARRIEQHQEIHAQANTISDHIDNLLGIAQEHVDEQHFLIEHLTDSTAD